MDVRSHFIPSLKAIFTNSSIIKVGYQIRSTLLAIAESFSLPEIAVTAHSILNPPFIDLGHQAKLTGALEDPNVSLHVLAGIILQKSFTPPSSDPYPWSVDISSAAIQALQVETDCLWQIWSALSIRESVGIKLQSDQLTAHGQLVTLVQGCKPVAHGSIIGNHPGYLDAIMDHDGQKRRINISASRSLIEITEVLVPLAIHTLHRQTIDWIFNHGHQAVVTSSQLRSRQATPPLSASSLTYGFSIPAPPSSILSEDHSNFSISYDSNLESEPDHSPWAIEFDIWRPSEDDLYTDGMSDSESELESDMEVISVLYLFFE